MELNNRVTVCMHVVALKTTVTTEQLATHVFCNAAELSISIPLIGLKQMGNSVDHQCRQTI